MLTAALMLSAVLAALAAGYGLMLARMPGQAWAWAQVVGAVVLVASLAVLALAEDLTLLVLALVSAAVSAALVVGVQVGLRQQDRDAA